MVSWSRLYFFDFLDLFRRRRFFDDRPLVALDCLLVDLRRSVFFLEERLVLLGIPLSFDARRIIIFGGFLRELFFFVDLVGGSILGLKIVEVESAVDEGEILLSESVEGDERLDSFVETVED